jgi:protein-disulfide isomerase
MATSARRKVRSTRTGKQAKRSSLSLWLVGGGLFFIALIAIVVIANTRQNTVPATTLDLPAGWISGTQLGNPEAKVTIQAWEDFLCPACAQWTAQVKPRLTEDYIKPGAVRLEFHQFPLDSHAPGSYMGAQASECAAEQNAFWPYHDVLFQAQRSQGQAGFTLDSLTKTAAGLELNQSQFSQCMGSQEKLPAVEAALQEAISLGLDRTPSILINGKRMEDPFAYEAINAEIDRLLSEQ